MDDRLTVEDIEGMLQPLDSEARVVFELRMGLDRGEPRTATEVAEQLHWPHSRVVAVLRRAVHLMPSGLQP